MATARKRGDSYEIRVFCGLAADGRRIDKQKTWTPDPGMTSKQIEKELERQKVLFEEQIRTGVSVDGNVRFRDFAQRWMEDYAKKQLAPKTVARYDDMLKRINAGIGHLKLQDIKPMHLNALYANLQEAGINMKAPRDADGKIIGEGKLAPKTVLEHHRVISKILATAVKWQLLDRNVALRADPPKVPYREIKFLDEADTKRLISLLDNEPMQYRTMIILLVYTGLRRGELCGLEWKDIDFDNQMLHVVRTSQYIGNKTLIVKEPKTRSGIRDFSLSATACQLLAEYQNWQEEIKAKLGDKWVDSDRLFTTWNGAPIYPDTITDWFAKFIKRHDFPYVTLHSLRHTNATLMIAEGTDVCTVSRRLGHANTATTLNIYAHALRSKDTEAANKLEAALSKAV